MSTRQLLDPRWHWLRNALDRLYAEVEPGDSMEALTIMVRDQNGQYVSYSAAPHLPELERRVVTDGDKLIAGVEATTVDVSPEAWGRP